MQIQIINPEQEIKKHNLPEITSPIIILNTGEFHEGGLFSPRIFGEINSERWNNQFSFIDLHSTILHPIVYDICNRHFQAIISIINHLKGLVIQNEQVVKITKTDLEISGFSAIQKYWPQVIDYLKKQKPEQVKLLDKINTPNAFIDKWLVIPPKYRSVSELKAGEISYNPINDKYADIIRKAQRSAIMAATVESSSFVLTKEVYELFTQQVELLKGKGGLFRGALLGRRVDFSARSVITADSSLASDEIGIPKMHAFKMTLPFVIHYIKNDIEIYRRIVKLEGISSISELLELFQAYTDKKRMISSETEKIIFNEVLPKVVKDKVVVYKRDPVLHRQSVMAGKIKLVDDFSIHVPVTIVGPLNSDFDGDTIEGRLRWKLKFINSGKTMILEDFITNLKEKEIETPYERSKE